MEERMFRIMEILQTKGSDIPLAGISAFKEEDGVFDVTTEYSRHGHRTFLRPKLAGNVIRFEITHVFGHLDLSQADNPTQFLLDLLISNAPTFLDSSACLGIKEIPPNHQFLALCATHQFRVTFRDEDIADVLSLALFDLFNAFIVQLAPPLVVWS